MDIINGMAYYFATLVNFVVTFGVLLFGGIALLLIASILMRAAHPKRDAKYVAGYLMLAVLAVITRIPAFDFLDRNNQARTLISVLVNAATVAIVVAAHWVSERIEIDDEEAV